VKDLKQILVTGGTGFLGAALVRRLVQEGREVRILDNGFRSSARRLQDIAGKVSFVQGDIRDAGIVESSVRDIDCVVHLAAINGTENFYKLPELVLDVGVRGLLNVIAACRKYSVGDLVVASSSEVYQTAHIIPTDETVPLNVPDVLNPRYSYAGSKILSELIAINYGRTDFERVVVFRPHNVYGPDMAWEHVLPQFVLRALDSTEAYPADPVPFSIQGDGRQTRAFTHINDMIDGLMILIDRGEHLNVYHIGNPEELTIKEVAERIFRYLRRRPELIAGSLPAGSTLRRCPNIRKIRSLGFEPRISFDAGLPSVIEWYKAHAHERPVPSV
jgi:dTDP-glucose 4,6-dehydratase/UDP-glucose 4-epimerase